MWSKLSSLRKQHHAMQWPRALSTGCYGGKSNKRVLFTGNFSVKNGIPSEVFLFSRFIAEYFVFTLVPCVLMKYADCLWKNALFHLAENSHLFSLQMENAPPVRFCLWQKLYCSIWQKFSPVFPYKWKALQASNHRPFDLAIKRVIEGSTR